MAWTPSDDRDFDIRQYIGHAAWMDEANCLGLDVNLFFPERGETCDYAKATCAGCTVQAECLDYALTSGERFGIWGGLSQRERTRVRVDGKEALVEVVHGTTAGFQTHRHDGTEPCESCRVARREYQRDHWVRTAS